MVRMKSTAMVLLLLLTLLSLHCPIVSLGVRRLTLSSIWKAVVVVKEKPNPLGYYVPQRIASAVATKSVSIK